MKNAFVTDARPTYFALLFNAFSECGALFLIFLQIAISAINIGTPKNSIHIVYAIKNALPQNSAHNHGNLRALPNPQLIILLQEWMLLYLSIFLIYLIFFLNTIYLFKLFLNSILIFNKRMSRKLILIFLFLVDLAPWKFSSTPL